MRGGRYWEEEEKRRCRVCEREGETRDHVWEECMGWRVERVWQEMAGEVQGDEGEGEEWLRRLDERRQVYGGMVV